MSDKKVIQLDDRIPKLREQRRQKTNRRFVIYITLFFILILIVAYIESPLSNIKSITVSGNQYLNANQIVQASSLSKSKKVWGVNQKAIKNHLKQLPSIKSVTVHTNLVSGQVDLKVTEYQRVAYLRTKDTYKPVLANGKFMPSDDLKAIPVHAPILVGFSEDQTLSNLSEQLTQLSPSILYNISEIDFTPTSLYPNGITLYLNDGHEALADIPTLAQKMKLYPSILSNLPIGQKGIVQLRVGAYWSPAEPDSTTNGGTP